MVTSGMKAAGYEYIIVDDSWMANHRNSKGQLMANPDRFPHGIKALADYIHSRGLKFGIYETPGPRSWELVGPTGSLHHEQTDAQTFARWGVDFLKYDLCCFDNKKNVLKAYITMAKALLATKRPIVYSVHTPGTSTSPNSRKPWQWAPRIANMWRTTGDIRDSWQSVMSILDQQVGLYKYAEPGHWNDPDMLEVGNGGMTTTEDNAHFSLWAILAAPPIAGNDLRYMNNTTKNILTNKEVIAVDQDPAGIQGHKTIDNDDQEVWVKPLSDGSKALLFLNRGETPAFMTINVSAIGLHCSDQCKIRNLWQHKSYTSEGLIRAKVPGHGVAMFRVWPESK
jgi:alpha-galactosidase